jgi:serine/threonine protein kinase
MSEEAKDLIKQLLVRDPSSRLGVKNDAQDIKEHAFFRDVNWEHVINKTKDGPYIEKDR